MTELAQLRAAAAAARALAAGSSEARGMSVPRDRPAAPELRFASTLRAETVVKDGLEFVQVEGYASVFEAGYEMYDWYGPYTEIVSAGAADVTLATNPEVVFRFNHAGTPMAGTRNGRLDLWADETGLGERALLNPRRGDVSDLVQAIEDDDVREQSFMFRITAGQWSPDYMEYRITEFDLERGDVGPVTYGANPHTSISARSGDFLTSIPSLSPLMAREALSLLSARADLAGAPVIPPVAPPEPKAPVAPVLRTEPAPAGSSISMLRTRLLVIESEED